MLQFCGILLISVDETVNFPVCDQFLRLCSESVVGFKTSETAVQVQAADVKHIDLHMEVASQAESIIVSADRPHAEAIERSRNTGNVVQVLSGEVIRSLPNANVADALGRLPSVTLFRDEGEGAYVLIRGTEPRLTNMMINGVTIPSPEATAQQVRLDALPAGGGRLPPFAPPAKSSCTSPSPISSSAANRSALVGWRAGVDGKQHGTRHRNN
jgi:hypothetical protein